MQIFFDSIGVTPLPTFLIDDFGNEFQVIPGDWCQHDSVNQIQIDIDVWFGLVNRAARAFE
jgi:hypothetical protein